MTVLSQLLLSLKGAEEIILEIGSSKDGCEGY